MRASTLLAVALAGVAAAQSSTASAASSSSTSGCDAQNIVDSCLATEQPRVDACSSNDWDCLCTNIINVLTCYNNCPGSTDRAGAEAQKTSWCGAASANPSTSTKASSASKTASSASSTASDSSSPSASSGSTGTPTTTGFASDSSSTASASPTGAAGFVSPATTFGALAGLFAIVGIAL